MVHSEYIVLGIEAEVLPASSQKPHSRLDLWPRRDFALELTRLEIALAVLAGIFCLGLWGDTGLHTDVIFFWTATLELRCVRCVRWMETAL